MRSPQVDQTKGQRFELPAIEPYFVRVKDVIISVLRWFLFCDPGEISKKCAIRGFFLHPCCAMKLEVRVIKGAWKSSLAIFISLMSSALLAACTSGGPYITKKLRDTSATVEKSCSDAALHHKADLSKIPFFPKYLDGVGASPFELFANSAEGVVSISRNGCAILLRFPEQVLSIAPPKWRHPGIGNEPFNGEIEGLSEKAVERCIVKRDGAVGLKTVGTSSVVSESLADPCQEAIDLETLEIVITTPSGRTNVFLLFDSIFVWMDL